MFFLKNYSIFSGPLHYLPVSIAGRTRGLPPARMNGRAEVREGERLLSVGTPALFECGEMVLQCVAKPREDQFKHCNNGASKKTATNNE
jgi:hypothetical protein